MTNQTPKDGSRTDGATLYGLYIVAITICLLGNLLIRIGTRAGWLPQWGKLSLAIGATAPLVIAAVLFWRLLLRDLDEMLQKIVLEGLAFAAIIYIPLAALYVNLRTAGAWVPRLDTPDILLTPAILFAVGIAIVRRRYL